METQPEQSSGQGKRKSETETISAMTMETVTKISKRSRTRLTETKCTIHDKTSPGYGWLLPGWVAEERHMESGRVYRYYYDPEGHLYKSQSEVIATWEKSGMVVIDKCTLYAKLISENLSL